jgi:hypothetical protein
VPKLPTLLGEVSRYSYFCTSPALQSYMLMTKKMAPSLDCMVRKLPSLLPSTGCSKATFTRRS